MRIFAAALGTETNTFSPLPTGWQTFRETLYHRSHATARSSNPFALPLHAWKHLAVSAGDTFVEGLAAFAQPAGLTTEDVWRELRATLLENLAAACPVDIVLLNLHGAMVAENCDDCEGDLLEGVRRLVGPDVVVGAELDLHCHLTERMVSAATALILYKEYPHTDVEDRAAELFRVCHAAADGQVQPVMALVDCRMLGVWRTSKPPVRALVDRMSALERQDGILSVSFCHGFPWADVPDVGARTLVVADGDRDLAARIAADLAAEIWEARESCRDDVLAIDDAIVATLAPVDGLTVMADVSDNAGGGAASDATFLLSALGAAGAQGVLYGCFWDPVAVRLCQEAGEGASLALRLGGKVGPLSGDPVDLPVRVRKIVEEACQTFGNGRQPMGTAVLLQADGIDLVVNTIRTQTFHPDAFTQFGIDLSGYRTVVVKSAQHFHAGFAPLARRILYIAGPGTVSPDFARLPVPRAGRPLWPQVDDPFEAASADPFDQTGRYPEPRDAAP
jgi:microcystin degradation protein MlrC